MSELNIGEKAKAYEKALEKARQLCAYPTTKPFISDLQDLFPELKESEDDRIRKALIRFHKSTIDVDGIEGEDIIAWLEKQSEQKPTDKVEPKFKVGDWIVKNNDSSINIDYSCCKITKVENGNYSIESICGYKGYNTFETFEKDYHLWTIQDAKNGDVLAVEPIEEHPSSFVAIYKERGLDFFNSYCFIGFDGKFYEAETGHSTEKIHPATKEQRDTLMKAMADAGYTFDFDKKELRKIEQKPAWSEEDEENLNWFEKFFRAESVIAEGKDIPQDRYLWFKNLKDRVQPQPKQEWSEEDELHIRELEGLVKQVWAIAEHENHKDTIHKMSDLSFFLKTLKPQNRWKPSDEQMKALKEVCDEHWEPDGLDPLYMLWEQLKKLRGE